MKSFPMLTCVALLAAAALRAEPAPVFGWQWPTPAVMAQCKPHRDKAVDALRAQAWADAARHLEASLATYPDSFDDWYNLACCRARLGSLEGAFAALERASELAAMYPADLARDPDLESLRRDSRYPGLLAAAARRRPRQVPTHDPTSLAATRDDATRVVRDVETRISAVEAFLGRKQAEDARATLAQWAAASLDGLASRARSAAERTELEWEALRQLINEERLAPKSEQLLPGALRRSSSPTLMASSHWQAVGEVRAVSQLFTVIVDEPDDTRRREANERYERDILAIAAASPDEPAVQASLLTLLSMSAGEITPSIRLYERLLRVAPDPPGARSLARSVAPGVVLAAEGLPDFRGVTLDGEAVSRAALAGHVTLLHVWATWCGPCLAELPHVRELHAEHRARGLRLVGLASEAPTMTAEDLRAWCKQHDMTWPQVLDNATGGTSVSDTLGVTRLPTLLLLDASGTRVVAHGSPESLKPVLDRLLPAKSDAVSVETPAQ